MKRSERILEFIRSKEKHTLKEDLKTAAAVGLSAQEVAAALNILRNNVSKELNKLHREGLIVKFVGRPVRYYDREILEHLLDKNLEGALEYRNIADLTYSKEESEANPFERLIGADKSLSRQVEQAKAAILYPPDGLHTLIVGQTGVGKTLFAHMMFAYGKSMHRFAADAPFVTFNCADYYNNPQLLISHIFGHIKGAFTGADTAKAGLVEAADGGVLFLDEIHRLPPEGQEMIFYFMDTGTFNCLGETTRCRRAKVLIIGATTEDPNSALTKTFVRRIPNIITIKPLSERTLEEKLDILKLLFTEEAQRVKKPIRISVETVKALIGSIGSGNVGQLKSNIKLLCAQAFLNGIDNPRLIEADFKMLPPSVKDGLLTLSSNRQALTELTKYVNEPLMVMPQGEAPPEEESSEPFNLYQVVEDKVALLKSEGISDDLIKQIVATDVNVYVKDLYNKKHSVNMTTRERLLKIVDESLVDFSEQISLYVQKRLNRSYRDRFLYAFSLHLSAFLKRAKAKNEIPYTEIEGAMPQDEKCLAVAMEIGDMIEKHYHLTVPRAEVEYIGLLLESADDDELNEKVTIVVATHGKSTASSMVDVAQKLFSSGDTPIIAVDMPLEVTPQVIFDKMTAMLKTAKVQNGVLLLADMGSLCNIGTMLAERLKVPVRTLDMVSTPLILEAMRKVDIVGMDLESIYESLRSFRGYEAEDTTSIENDSGEVIVTICSSGQGAALKLKAMVEEILAEVGRALEVIPVGAASLEKELTNISHKQHILCAIGMKKPQMKIPFISIEQLINGPGEDILKELVVKREVKINLAPRAKNNLVVQKLCEDSLQKFLTYLNPTKIMGVLMEFDRIIEKELKLKLSNPLKVRLIVHTGCALERIVTRSPLVYKDDKTKIDTQKLQAIKKAAKVFDKTLKLRFEEDEYYFIANMI